MPRRKIVLSIAHYKLDEVITVLKEISKKPHNEGEEVQIINIEDEKDEKK